MPELYAAGKWEEIKAHCEEDVALTEMLYSKAQRLGLVPMLKFEVNENGE